MEVRERYKKKKFSFFSPIKKQVLYLSGDGKKAVQYTTFGGWPTIAYFKLKNGKLTKFRFERCNRMSFKFKSLKHFKD